jgi:putative DNA primase/helicase
MGVEDKNGSRVIQLPGMDNEEDSNYRPDDDELAGQVREVLADDWRWFWGSWYRYESGYWQAEKTIFKIVRQVLRANRRFGVSVSRNKCQSVEWLAQQDHLIPDESAIDNYPRYFNLKNGLFNLDTMRLEKHNRDVLVTNQASFAYDPAANPVHFKDWISDMLVQPDGVTTDWSLVNLVQEAIGYTLTADTGFRTSFWLYGPTASGKSTLLKLLMSLMGEYQETLDLNQIGTNRFLLARIAGKRLVTFGEADAQTRLADGIYKALVDSGGEVVADVKNQDPIVFTPQCKVWWAMNNLPHVGDRSGAVDSRVKIIPMRRSVPKSEWDFALDEKLHNELPGIFNWALQGLERLRQQRGFTHVNQVEAMQEEYRLASDIYGSFLEDEDWCIRNDGRTEPIDLYTALRAWANDNGIRFHASAPKVRREWERLGLVYGRSNGRRHYEGVELTGKAQRRVNDVSSS